MITVLKYLRAVLIAPVANAFDFILARQGVTIGKVAAEVGRRWGPGLRHLKMDELTALEQEIGLALRDPDAAAQWLRMARALAGGNYEDMVRLLVEQNAAVMKRRNGSPWVHLTRDRLEVRFREEAGVLAGRAELPTLWRHSYFLDSLYTVVLTRERAG